MNISDKLSLKLIEIKKVLKISVLIFIIYYTILFSIGILFYPTINYINPFIVVLERIFFLLAVLIVGMLIAKVVENKNYLNGILGGVSFFIFSIAVFVFRYGLENYFSLHNLFGSIIWSIFIGLLGFQFFGYKKQINFYWTVNFVLFFYIFFVYFTVPVMFSYFSLNSILVVLFISFFIGSIKLFLTISHLRKNWTNFYLELKNIFKKTTIEGELIKAFDLGLFFLSLGIVSIAVVFLLKFLT